MMHQQLCQEIHVLFSTDIYNVTFKVLNCIFDWTEEDTTFR